MLSPGLTFRPPPMPPLGNLVIGPNSTEFHNSGSVTARLTCQQLRPSRTHPFTDDDGVAITLLTTDLTVTTARVPYTVTTRGLHDTHTDEIIQPIQPARRCHHNAAGLRRVLFQVQRRDAELTMPTATPGQVVGDIR